MIVVTQEGVYRHRILGIFTEHGAISEAVGLAEKSVSEESDHYHTCYVFSMTAGDTSNDNEKPMFEVIWDDNANRTKCLPLDKNWRPV